MDDKELVLIEPRARRVPQVMYLGAIAVKGTEHLPTPQLVVYSTNPVILRTLVNSHNELIKLKKEKVDAK